jgi:hypothetical protein
MDLVLSPQSTNPILMKKYSEKIEVQVIHCLEKSNQSKVVNTFLLLFDSFNLNLNLIFHFLLDEQPSVYISFVPKGKESQLPPENSLKIFLRYKDVSGATVNITNEKELTTVLSQGIQVCISMTSDKETK